MSARYYDIWSDYAAVVGDYGKQTPPETAIVYAGYSYEDYSGAALLVWRDGDKWFENNDGHCSCNGLENWEPEETSAAALLMRKEWPGLHEAVELAQAAGAVDPVAGTSTS